MPIDIDMVVGSPLPADPFSWVERDVILYHLGIGAGNPPTSAAELRYTYEAELAVLPTFATIPPFAAMMALGGLEGMDINLAQILHGDQTVRLHRPLPVSGEVVQEGRVEAVFDRGRGALVVLEVVSRLDGEPLFTNRSSIYVRGEGGFGGDPGPERRHQPPERDPDLVTESPTLPQQALLYRMVSGDRNPLHADPAFAAFAGFDRPILHGLCTFGVVAKAVVDHALGGDPHVVAEVEGRFSGVVFPGETVVTRMWEEGDTVLVAATTLERGEPVLSNAAVVRR